MQHLQEAQGSDIPVSQLLLQQSEALTALVSHVANQDGFLGYGAGSASSFSLSSERSYILADLAARKGNFMLKVAQNAARRLRPAETLLQKLAKLQTR